MKKLFITLLLYLFCQSAFAADMIIIRGASGSAAFEKPLKKAVKKWQQLAKKAGLKSKTISSKKSKEELTAALKAQKKDSPEALWLIFAGHGTYLDKEAKFNLAGEDISARELKHLLVDFSRETILINCAPASAPFLSELSSPGRIIISATKNEHQAYYTKFNEIMPQAVDSPEADMDEDGQVSLFEAFLYASRQVELYYEQQERISGENALLDDNGDRRGSMLSHYKGLHPAEANDKIDGSRAHQVHLIESAEEAAMSKENKQKRQQLERKIKQLKNGKDSMSKKVYYEELEKLLLELGGVYEKTGNR